MGVLIGAERDALLVELEKGFERVRAQTGCAATLDDLDRIFYLRDLVLQQGYVTPYLSRAVCSRIRDTISSWTGQLHNWVMPNPASMISMSESGIWSDADKDDMIALMREQMALVERNTIAGLTHDSAAEGAFIDGALALWAKHLPALTGYARRAQEYWETPPQKHRRNADS